MALEWRDVTPTQKQKPHSWTRPNPDPHLGLVGFWGPCGRDGMGDVCLAFFILFAFNPGRLSHLQEGKQSPFVRPTPSPSSRDYARFFEIPPP